MEPFTVSGSFHLPKSSRTVRGEFTFDGSRAVVNLAGPVVFHRTPQGQDLPYEGEETAEHPVIHGELDDGRLVTALDCRGSHRASWNWLESWRCAIALLGGHAEGDSFSRVSLHFDCLNAWAEPPPVVSDQKIGDGSAVLDTSRHELERADFDGVTVKLIAHVSGRWGGDTADVRRICSLVAEVPPSSFGQLSDDWIRPIHELLVVLLGRPVRLTRVFVRPENDTSRETFEALYSPVQPSSTDEPERGSLIGWGNPTTYLRTELPISFQELIAGWIPLRARHRESVTLLCGPYLAPFMYLEHRYSSAFQSAEHIAGGFGGKELATAEHRVRVKAIVDAARAQQVASETIEWAQRVLKPRNDQPLSGAIKDLLLKTGPIGADILDRDPNFPTLAASARADVSHPRADSASTEVFYWCGEALTWVVRAYLLEALGVELAGLREHVVSRGHFPQVLDGLTTTRQSD